MLFFFPLFLYLLTCLLAYLQAGEQTSFIKLKPGNNNAGTTDTDDDDDDDNGDDDPCTFGLLIHHLPIMLALPSAPFSLIKVQLVLPPFFFVTFLTVSESVALLGICKQEAGE